MEEVTVLSLFMYTLACFPLFCLMFINPILVIALQSLSSISRAHRSIFTSLSRHSHSSLSLLALVQISSCGGDLELSLPLLELCWFGFLCPTAPVLGHLGDTTVCVCSSGFGRFPVWLYHCLLTPPLLSGIECLGVMLRD